MSMETWTVPPRAKIIQALSLVSEGDIKWLSSNIAKINGKTVQVKSNGVYTNGNKKNYLDEKALAALMIKGELSFSERISEKIKGFDCFPDCSLSEIEKKAKEYLEDYKVYEKEVDAFINIVNDEIRGKKFEILKMKRDQVSILGFR